MESWYTKSGKDGNLKGVAEIVSNQISRNKERKKIQKQREVGLDNLLHGFIYLIFYFSFLVFFFWSPRGVGTGKEGKEKEKGKGGRWAASLLFGRAHPC